VLLQTRGSRSSAARRPLLFWRAAAKRLSSTFSSRHLDSVRGPWSSAIPDRRSTVARRAIQHPFHTRSSCGLTGPEKPPTADSAIDTRSIPPPTAIKGTATSRSANNHSNCCWRYTPYTHRVAGNAWPATWRLSSRTRTVWYEGNTWPHDGGALES
jgi:hypothetical protein